MKKILKFEIPILVGKFSLNLPTHWKFLSFQVQNQKPVIWIVGDLEEEKTDVFFQTLFTGEEIPENSNYLGTIQLGTFVVHLFIPLFNRD